MAGGDFSSRKCSIHGSETACYISKKSRNWPLWAHVVSERTQKNTTYSRWVRRWKWLRTLFCRKNSSNLQFYFGYGDSSLFRSFSTTTTVVCCLWNPHAPAEGGIEPAWNLAYQTVSMKPADFVMPDCIWIRNREKMYWHILKRKKQALLASMKSHNQINVLYFSYYHHLRHNDIH